MLQRVSFCVICFVGAALAIGISSATSLSSTNEINTQNMHLIEDIPAVAYEYAIVPSSEYNLNGNNTTEMSLMDSVLTPLTSLASIGFNAISAFKWILVTISPVLLGMALVIAFCAFTDYCTLTIEYPFSSDFKMTVPDLNDVEHFVMESYNKYNNLQNHMLS